MSVFTPVPARADGHLKQTELVVVKKLVKALANCPETAHLVKMTLEGEPRFGAASVYMEHELLRSIFFASYVAASQGRILEVRER